MKKFKDMNIVLIGGGTGLSTLIMGLKKYNNKISAIVTVTDDGGSSGRLREEFDIIPPGDIRNCLVALSKEDSTIANLFSYRFGGKGAISGHSFGNLFLMAMSDICGSFEKGLAEASKILASEGNVIPSTFEKVHLVAEDEQGKVILGETQIGKIKGNITKLEISPRDVKPAKQAITAIKNADLVILGPGSFYTSVVSNLLIEDIKNELKKSAAKKIFICNIMSQPGETKGYTSEEYLYILRDYLCENIIDYILINDSEIPNKLLERYNRFDSFQVKFSKGKSKGLEKTEKIIDDFFGEEYSQNSVFARHDPKKLALKIKKIVEGAN